MSQNPADCDSLMQGVTLMLLCIVMWRNCRNMSQSDNYNMVCEINNVSYIDLERHILMPCNAGSHVDVLVNAT